MKAKYTLFICPKCDEPSQYAGFCDTCNLRLRQVVVIPVPVLRESVEQIQSPVAKTIYEEFVGSLLGRSSPPSG